MDTWSVCIHIHVHVQMCVPVTTLCVHVYPSFICISTCFCLVTQIHSYATEILHTLYIYSKLQSPQYLINNCVNYPQMTNKLLCEVLSRPQCLNMDKKSFSLSTSVRAWCVYLGFPPSTGSDEGAAGQWSPGEYSEQCWQHTLLPSHRGTSQDT